jgi:hypothetical protein
MYTMEEQDIKNIWKTYDARLQEAKEQSDRSWALNLRLFEEMQSRKAGSALRKLKILKTTGIVVTVLYLVALGWALAFAITHYSSAWNYFIVSMGAIFIINFKGLSDYVRHLIMASEINYSGSVTEVQQKLSRLQMSIVQHTRFMYLQIPFWSTFYLSDKWFPHSVGWAYIIIHVICTGAMVYASYWLYTRLTVENMQKSKFIRKLVGGSGIGSVSKAMEFYREIEEFKK